MQQTQTIPRPRASLSPHQNKVRPRLSTFETVSRVYDNKSYTSQLHKLFDSMIKSPSRKPSPNKSRMVSSSFVNPSALNNSSRDIPAPYGDNLLTEVQQQASEIAFQDISSGSILPVVSRGSLVHGKHKRTASLLTPTDQTGKDAFINTRKFQKTPLSFLGDSPIDLVQDTLTHKPRKESPSIRTQLIQYSTYSTKNARPSVTPNRRVVIPVPSRCKPNQGENPIRIALEGSKNEANNNQLRSKESEKTQKRSPLVSWQQTEDDNEGSDDDIILNETFLPNMEDMLIIRHEMQGSQASLILSTMEDFDKDSVPVSIRESLKNNKRGSVKMRDLLENERLASNKYAPSMRRTLTLKDHTEARNKENSSHGIRNKAPSGRDVGSFEAQMIAVESSYKRSKDNRHEEDRKNIRDRSQDHPSRRYNSNSRPRNVTEEGDNRQLNVKTNESDIENRHKRTSGDSPLRVFRRTHQNGFSSAKKSTDTSFEGKKDVEQRRPEHKRVASIGVTNLPSKKA